MSKPLTESELAALRALDTPTVCNALEEIDSKFPQRTQKQPETLEIDGDMLMLLQQYS